MSLAGIITNLADRRNTGLADIGDWSSGTSIVFLVTAARLWDDVSLDCV